MFATATPSSSGRWGTRLIICVNTPWRLRASASTSTVRSARSGSSSRCATRYGSVCVYGPIRTRRRPCTRIRAVPSGTRTIRCTTAVTPTSWTMSGGGSFISESRLTAITSIRSGVSSTSSSRRSERSSPTASGATASGKRTVSFSGRTGSVSGTTSAVATSAVTTSVVGSSVLTGPA